MEVGEAIDGARLREKGGAGAICRRPRLLVLGMLDLAHYLDAPALDVGGLIAQRLERDANLDLVAEVGEVTLGLIDIVGTEVGRLAAGGGDDESLRAADALLDDGAVHLHA